ncbi:MAG: Holliday junction resolvase RuvX [Aquabacterium sp.]|jgi:putative Holliday junction resolvase|uniref:Holliday junction resolvase RuvX n=1 Tax=Aquabacterium sp. TaxID=1872578 RepID=UPI002A368293|nr:Holliday junction resolvase RuvX [Aquabacterium sp.]MDX9843022.1 Holliday junction resolvase RuvX [Aquabacterium sp.]
MSAQPASAIRHFLAFDYGLKRVGVATGNSLTRQAQPLRTIAAEGAERFAQIGKLIDEWRPDALVIGVPFHPDGAEHENTLRARKFGGQLRGRFHLPVHEVDERYSTTEAQGFGAQDLDAASAAILLQQYFNDHPGDDIRKEA